MNSIATKQRIYSIDLLRGLIMIIMALDHTRDFFHISAFTADPLDVGTTTPMLYFTRWITHFCAPVFVFLAGLSAWLQTRRKSPGELQRFLITRGLWLILLEITIVNLGIAADIHFSIIALQTIWSIGISMVFLGLAIRLPFAAIAAIAAIIILGHNVLDYFEAQRSGNLPFWWHLIHSRGFFPISEKHALLILYPFLPWTGLMFAGYCVGRVYTDFDPAKRKRWLLQWGCILIVFFIGLRMARFYGDNIPWSTQSSVLYTVLSFINVQKYPPSLLYMCITIGPALLFLAATEKISNRLASVIMVYGRVPMFYYILHFYLLTILRIIYYLQRGHSFQEGLAGVPNNPFKFVAPGEGLSLGGVYLVWLSVVIALYPLCSWYNRYKTNHPEKKWLSYL